MQKTKTIISLVAIAVFFVGATYIMTIPSEKYDTSRVEGVQQGLQENPTQSTSGTSQQPVKAPVTTTPKATSTSSSSTSTSSSTTVPTKSTYSMTEVRQHASSSSCWSVVAGGVYPHVVD